MEDYRIERDSLGEVKVPADALYGAQTQRAMENFPVSGIRFPRVFIGTLGIIKWASATVNGELGLLDKDLAYAIGIASDEVASGKWDNQFPLDIFQTGSGTSTNMNANEVIGNLARKILAARGVAKAVHPNDHVNRCQSTNDVIPSAIHISAYTQLTEILLPSLEKLEAALEKRSHEFKDVIKTGRTHLMDAVPLSFGQEIGGWAYQMRQCRERIHDCLPRLSMIAMGGTAVGTGLNAHPDFGRLVAAKIAEKTGLPFREAENHFAAQAAMDTAAELSGILKTCASALMKISNDLRLINSGPVGGLSEIILPVLQPGSSIMPGKANPVICEAVIMACCRVIGNDVAITLANGRGEFELNVMLPLIAHNLIESITILGNSARLLGEKAVEGFTLNSERVSGTVERNPILVTSLTPIIGYERAAEIAKRARDEGRKIKEVAAEMTDLSPSDLDRLLDPGKMAGER